MAIARTPVGIVGGGPAGLILCHLLRLRGIESVVLEARSRQYIEQRVRAGVLEQGTVGLLSDAGLGARMQREGLQHRGIHLRFGGVSRPIDFAALTGKSVTVYGQQEVVRDLVAAALSAGTRIEFEVTAVVLDQLSSAQPLIRYRDQRGEPQQLQCDFIAGCDGFHGICRAAIPAAALRYYEREYPFGWLGILAHAPPLADELIYTHHERGFALFSMRSPQIARHYLQCPPDENLAEWPDERIWQELERRLEGADSLVLPRGDIFQKGVTPMRSFVTEPMQYGRLFLAGDAAHIVPPTGAKGMNLAASDVRSLALALAEFYDSGSMRRLERYSESCLRRIWQAQRFSWWMTSMLHRFEHHGEFDRRVQLAELDYLTGSRAASAALAENYVGLPYQD
jgi:p-hydroxybenzoate 3-monooxygenase